MTTQWERDRLVIYLHLCPRKGQGEFGFGFIKDRDEKMKPNSITLVFIGFGERISFFFKYLFI